MLFGLLFIYWNCINVGNSCTQFGKVSAIHSNDYYYDLINLTDFYTYYCVLGFYDKSYLHHKNKKQHRRGTICNTRIKHWIREQFEGKYDHWKRDLFSSVNWPVLSWLSLLSTVTNQC